MAQLALAAERGASLLEALRLSARGDVRPLRHLPSVWALTVAVSLFVGVVHLFLPYPFPFVSLLCLFIIYVSTRFAVRDTANLHPVSLAEAELAAGLAEHMAEGLSLSQAMIRMPRLFTAAQVALVRAGEEASDLAPALETLAAQFHAREASSAFGFRRIYPFLTIAVAVGPIAFILVMILPKFVDIFAQLGVDLPPFTVAVIRIIAGDSIGTVPVNLLLALVLVVIVDQTLRPPLGRLFSGAACAYVLLVLLGASGEAVLALLRTHLIDDSLLHLLWLVLLGALGFLFPSLSEMISLRTSAALSAVAARLPARSQRAHALERAAFLRSVGLLLARRVPAAETLHAAAPTLQGTALERRARRAARRLEQGVALSRALSDEHIVTARQAAMLSLAAHAGDLPAECQALARALTDEARDRLARRERVARPFAFVAVAALLGLVLVALYLPIFQVAIVSTRLQ